MKPIWNSVWKCKNYTQVKFSFLWGNSQFLTLPGKSEKTAQWKPLKFDPVSTHWKTWKYSLIVSEKKGEKFRKMPQSAAPFPAVTSGKPVRTNYSAVKLGKTRSHSLKQNPEQESFFFFLFLGGNERKWAWPLNFKWKKRGKRERVRSGCKTFFFECCRFCSTFLSVWHADTSAAIC